MIVFQKQQRLLVTILRHAVIGHASDKITPTRNDDDGDGSIAETPSHEGSTRKHKDKRDDLSNHAVTPAALAHNL